MQFLKFKNAVYKIYLELLVFDRKKRSVLKARWAKKHLLKYVDAAIIRTSAAALAAETVNDRKIIWQYWHQGVENAPELIKKCLASVKHFNPDYEVKVLTFETIEDYVSLPQRYYDLLARGKMKTALFSDILRLYLLRQYGGIWIDATIMLTAPLPPDIFESEFMVMQKDVKTDLSENIMSCFLIRSRSDSLFLELIKQTLECYWRDNDFVINYFMFEHIATMLALYSSELTAKWNSMPYYSAEDAGILQQNLFLPFDIERFEKIKQKISIHKLTHKKLPPAAVQATFYHHLTGGDDL